MEDPPLLAFRIIGCSVVTIFVGITIITYITSGMFYPDTIAQICSEICLLAAYTCILLIMTDKAEIDKGFCLGVSIFLQFIFLTFFMFAMLEVFCMSRYLLDYVPKNILTTTRSLLFLGIGLPFVITGLSAIILYEQYTSKTNCWLDMSGEALWASVGPVCVFVGVQTILLVLVITVSDVPYFLAGNEYDRALCFLRTRWSSLIITPFAVISWVFGIFASHTNKEAYYAAFTVSSIFLGVVLCILRLSTDDEMRKVLMSHILCYLERSKNKVTMWSDKVVANKPLPVEKKFVSDGTRANGDSKNHITVHR